jgi:hypothetical protein
MTWEVKKRARLGVELDLGAQGLFLNINGLTVLAV